MGGINIEFLFLFARANFYLGVKAVLSKLNALPEDNYINTDSF